MLLCAPRPTRRPGAGRRDDLSGAGAGPHLSVEANVMLGQEKAKLGLIDRREHRRIVTDALDLLDHPDIRPDARVDSLGVGAQQLVEVARALVSSAQSSSSTSQRAASPKEMPNACSPSSTA